MRDGNAFTACTVNVYSLYSLSCLLIVTLSNGIDRQPIRHMTCQMTQKALAHQC